MPFVYEFKINGQKIDNVEQGFTTTRKWEEALDEAKLSIPFLTNKEPNKMYGLLDIIIKEIDNHIDKNIIDTKTHQMLIISDMVEPIGSYGYYRHHINAIEYTAKLDAYIMPCFIHSLQIKEKGQAPFTITNDSRIIVSKANQPQLDKNQAVVYAVMPYLYVNKTYYTNTAIKLGVFEACKQATIKWTNQYEYNDSAVYVKTNAPISNNRVVLYSEAGSMLKTDWILPKGTWEIEYGFVAKDFRKSDSPEDRILDGTDCMVYKFIIEVIDSVENTLYDLLMRVRKAVSKYGGLENITNFDNTRIFDISNDDIDYLKSIKAPQVFLDTATTRQMLIFLLSYVNALPRLRKGTTRDILSLEHYGVVQGVYSKKDLTAISGSQNTNQTGTQSYTHFRQALPNNLDTPTTFVPSKNAYQGVRASSNGVQLTDSNFEFQLPKDKPLYKPIKFSGKVTTKYTFQGFDTPLQNSYELDLDLTDRLLNITDWELRDYTGNVLDITTTPFWAFDLGLRPNRTGNLNWAMGDTSIKLSQVYGNNYKTNLIFNVILEAVYEYFALNVPFRNTIISTGDGDKDVFSPQVKIDIITPTNSNYKDLMFNLEYISLEDLIVKQEKIDTTQIDFYNDLRQNQDESILNIIRGSRKVFGSLQMVGNKQYSFSKIHFSLADVYGIGTKDVNDYTITDITLEYYNNFIVATYFITKHYNKIQQATFVDQTYRWRDTYAISVVDRQEHYKDYLMLAPLNETISNQATLLPSNTNKYIKKMIFSKALGIIDYDILGKSKATAVVLKTDGMIDFYGSEISGKLLATPLTSYGVKQALLFKFGFSDNQVAGVRIKKNGSLEFNQPVRYTDRYGRFNNLSFAIVNELNDSFDKDNYPIVHCFGEDHALYNSKIYFNTFYHDDTISAAGLGTHYLIVDKDTLTNFNLTYQLNVMSYHIGQYVLGLKFFTENPIVDNSEVIEKVYIYSYDNNDYYNDYEDLYIKDGYYSKVELKTNCDDANFTFDGESFIATITIPSGKTLTNWAIGTNDGDLFIACNGVGDETQPYSFKVVNLHFRPQIKEIGSVDYND